MTVCRLLAVIAEREVEVRPHLEAFAELCLRSREYQGHGWGYATLQGGRWQRRRALGPIWEARLPQGERARVLVAHARSAFRDEGTDDVENNMPFLGGPLAFAFNGELRGVRLAVGGRTGAERVFNLVRGQGRESLAEGVARAVALLRRRSRRVRACNFLLAEPGALHLHTLFDAEEEYFTMHTRRSGGETVVCSEPYPGEGAGWTPLPNGVQRVFPC